MLKLNVRAYLKAKFRSEEYGKNWAVPCPECDSGRGKNHLYVNVETGQAICYRCAEKDRGGKYRTLADLIARLEDVSFEKALRFIKENSDREWTSDDYPVEESAELKAIQLPSEYRASWGKFYESDAPRSVKTFFEKRGVDEATRMQYRIGYASTGKYKLRAIVPVTYKGANWSFVARDVTGKAERKVLDPPGARKSRYLFNVDSLTVGGHAVITEGVWDAMRVGPPGVALLGHSLSDYQLSLLLAAQPRYVTVLLDGDMKEAAEKMGARLSDYFDTVRVVHLDGDPDDYSRKDLWKRVLATAPVGSGAFQRLRKAAQSLQ